MLVRRVLLKRKTFQQYKMDRSQVQGVGLAYQQIGNSRPCTLLKLQEGLELVSKGIVCLVDKVDAWLNKLTSSD